VLEKLLILSFIASKKIGKKKEERKIKEKKRINIYLTFNMVEFSSKQLPF
jgi:hypothetical protein